MKQLTEQGFGLIEITIIIITIGILAAIAMQSMTALITDSRKINTEKEMLMLSDAIVGNPEINNNSIRSDFGYVGDIGSFPATLEALKTNPGSYATWDGPYIPDQYIEDTDGYKTDEWGTTYNYAGGTTITSNGSGSAITKTITSSTNDYLINRYIGTVKDASNSSPGSTYQDSLAINIIIPNGSGGTSVKSSTVDVTGNFILDSLPVGQHPLRIIYTPNVDTLFHIVTILPRHKNSRMYKFASSYFTSSSGGSGGGGSATSGSEILRPDGSGFLTELDRQNCIANFECVNEEISDDSSSYTIGSDIDWLYDIYSLTNHTTGSGTIDSVIVTINVLGNGNNQKAQTLLRTDNVTNEGNLETPPSTYTNHSTTYILNPTTSAVWNWSDIDALEIGAGLKRGAQLTQVWVEVFYTN